MEKKERRSEPKRRAGIERRKFNDPDYKGPERRRLNERRTTKKRRNAA